MAIYRVIYHSSLGSHEILQLNTQQLGLTVYLKGETRWGPVSTAVGRLPQPWRCKLSGHWGMRPWGRGWCPVRQGGRCPPLIVHLFCVQHIAQGSVETRLRAWHTVVAEWLSLDWTYSFRLDIKPYSFTMDPCNAHRLTCPGQHCYPAGIWVLRALR